MDLLNNSNVNYNTRMQTDIMKAIREIPLIDEETILTAEKFFDFSEEADLTLLENIKFQILDSQYYENSILLFQRMTREKDCEFGDRYILFLDAVGANTIYALLSYNFDNSFKRDSIFNYRISHAYKRKYSSEQTKMKETALIAKSSAHNIISSERLLTLAKNEPSILYQAGKEYCKGQLADTQLKLYALALAYTKSDDEKNIIEKIASTVSAKLDIESIKDMTGFILETAQKADWNNADVYEFMVSVLFMSMNHRQEIEELLKDKVKGKELEFLSILYVNVPNLYFENNIEKLLKIIEIERSEIFIERCIKQAVIYAWRRSSNGYKAESMLYATAEKYPKQFIGVMNSMEEIVDTGGYHIYNSQYYCSFYEQMYKILKRRNPKAIKDEKVNFYDGITNLAITSMQESSKIAQEEIGKYLRGESSLSILEPYFDTLQTNLATSSGGYYAADTDRIIKTCINNNAEFKRRYIAFATIQRKLLVYNQINSNSRNTSYEEVIQDIIMEKVPTKYRFELYDYIYNAIYSDSGKEKFQKIVLSKMKRFSGSYNEEYESICINGDIFSRKIYVQYLEETNDKDKNKEKLFSMFEDKSKEVRKAVVETISKHKEYESDVLSLLQAKKISARETAVDILTIWGAENYKEILLNMSQNEKSKKLSEKINAVLSIQIQSSDNENGKVFSPILFVEEIHKGGRARQLSWLYQTPNTAVHFNNGNEADDKYLQAIMLCYAGAGTLGVNENANSLAKELNQGELNQFAYDIFSKWIAAGAEAKKKWVLYFSIIHGGYNMIEIALHYIREWSENSRGAIASETVRAVAMNGSSDALMAVDNMAHKFKHKQVKNAAIQALDSAAEELGITSDELGDRIVPDLGFDEKMERIFDYGTRKFKVYLTPTLEIEIFDESNKKLKTIPAPGKKDDEETAKQSNAEFKQMKKQLKTVISIQKTRLETALLADRRWSAESWRNLFVKNPVMHSFAIGLVWAAYENEELVQTFRYMEDGSFNTCDEDEYELPENVTIGLIHPIDIDEEELSAWKEQLSDYEIVQPIEQLERKVYRIKEDEIGKIELTRFNGIKINDFTLIGRMTKLGWSKGSVADAGCFHEFYREDVVKRTKKSDGTFELTGNAVELSFEGAYVSGTGEEVTIEGLRFYQPGTVKRGSYLYDDVDDKRAIKLDKINARYFSEIINQLETILKLSE